MTAPQKTADRILETSRRLFNDKGYAATTLTEIAAAIGISQGNLTYHFPTKRDLIERLQEDARHVMSRRRAAHKPGSVADDYVEHLLFAMALTWRYRFLLRDRNQFTSDQAASAATPEMIADLEELGNLVKRTGEAGYFRQDLNVDAEILTHALWIVSRFWMDYLRELEGRTEITWTDQERGVQHHFAVLLPCLTAPARRQFERAMKKATEAQRQSS